MRNERLGGVQCSLHDLFDWGPCKSAICEALDEMQAREGIDS